MKDRSPELAELTDRALRKHPPRIAVLPWGATEAHNRHLPYGTDTIQALHVARTAAADANQRGADAVVLPAIPFGNNAQQLDQAATIHITTPTALALLGDVVRSLKTQGVTRLIVVNGHGGNTFKPLVRDLMHETGVFIAVADLFAMCPDTHAAVFERPGDHADEMETSMMLHLRPDLVQMADAGPGERVPFDVQGFGQPGVWTPRPWSRCHPDTGSGDPSLATAAKGAAFLDAVCGALAEVIVNVSAAKSGDSPVA